MKVRVFIPGKEAKKIKEKISPMLNIESENFRPELEMVSLGKMSKENFLLIFILTI